MLNSDIRSRFLQSLAADSQFYQLFDHLPGISFFAKNGRIREDGRMVHDMYLMQVKSPDKSVEPWDYYNVVQTFKGEEAWTTKAESKCPLWK